MQNFYKNEQQMSENEKNAKPAVQEANKKPLQPIQ